MTDGREPAIADVPVNLPAPVAATARRALWWSIANNAVGRVGTTLIGIVLARILVPEDYGMYAVALVALTGLLAVNELGVSLAVVRWPGDVSRIAPTVVTLSIASSVVLWLAMFFAAPVVANALNATDATTFVRFLSLSVLIDAVTAVPAALMTREFMQRERMLVDSAGFVIASLTAIVLAVLGYGAWALVWSALLGNIVNAAFILRYAPRRYLPGFRIDVARELLSFGLPLALASLIITALLNVDYVVIGAELGPAALGFYLLAFNLSTWPVNMFSAPARRVSLPLFARLNAGNASASTAFVPVCSVMIMFTLPACLAIAVFAEPMIRTVYGDTWLAAASVLPWLMVLALARVLSELAYDFLVALGASRSNLALQFIWLVALLVTLPVAVKAGGIEGVAIAHAGIALLIAGPAYAFVLRGTGVSLRAIAVQIVRPLAGTALAAGAGVAVLVLVDGRLIQLGLGCALVGIIYLAVVYPMRALLRAPAASAA
jgi:PST family polysaccharide transporter